MTDESSAIMNLAQAGAVTTTEQLAHLLRQLRRRQARQRGGPELTYRELAARTGWSIGTLAGYFGGRTLPPTDRFDVLVTLLGATPAERGALATARDRTHEHRRYPRPSTAASVPVPRQLPGAGAHFVGRGRELAELDRLLLERQPAAGTIAVVSGGAGVGKTSLAVHWGHRVADLLPDGQLYVSLRGFDPDHPPTGPAEAVRDLLDAMGVAGRAVPASGAAQVGLYRSLVATRRMLIILDDARDADQVRPLLPGAPGCVTVVTSRNQLGGLVAVEGAQHLVLDVLPVPEARDLLARRLGTGRVAAEPEVVDELIARCARLPLALAVVAARASARPTFRLAVLAEELRGARNSLDPFSGDDPSADARAAFTCSYARLGAPAAELFRRIGGHPGPDLTEPVAASVAGVPLARVRPALAELTRAHLVTEHLPGRYTLHDLLRVFAVEQARRLDPDECRRAAVRRGLDHYLGTAYQAALLLHPAGDPITLIPTDADVTPERLADREQARRWLESEHRVLVRAVGQAATCGFSGHAWQLAWTLANFLDWHGHWHDLGGVQEVALRAATLAGDEVGQVHARRLAARAGNRLGRYDAARTHLERAITLCRRIGLPAVEARCHLDLALTLELSGRCQAALTHARRALALYHAAGHRPGYAAALGIVGWYHALLDAPERALACCRRAVLLQAELGAPYQLPSTLDSLGYAYHRLGRYARAAESYRRAVELYRETGDRYHEADTLVHLGDCHEAAGATDTALAAWRQALEILDGLRHPAAADVRARCQPFVATGRRRPGRPTAPSR